MKKNTFPSNVLISIIVIFVISGIILLIIIPEIHQSKTKSKNKNIVFDINGIAILSEYPDIKLYKDFITPEEAEHIILLSSGRFKRSMVLKDGKNVIDDFRTSSSAYLSKSQDDVIKSIEEKVSKIVNCDIGKIESLQIVKYDDKQKFSPHYDWFSDKDISKQGGQRKHTFLIYLNDIKEENGGYTIFPNLGIKIQPQIGMALYFDNLDREGKGNKSTLHGGEPINGKNITKWACNVWIKE